MSIQTWKDEFYTEIPDCIHDSMSWMEAVDHSLKKWDGLLPENSQKHDVLKSFMSLFEVDQDGILTRNSFDVDDSSCALCVKSMAVSENCSECPLYQVRGNKSCDSFIAEIDNGDSPYHVFTRTGNPEPMIFWLQKTKESLT